jgi:hypothetical protein
MEQLVQQVYKAIQVQQVLKDLLALLVQMEQLVQQVYKATQV